VLDELGHTCQQGHILFDYLTVSGAQDLDYHLSAINQPGPMNLGHGGRGHCCLFDGGKEQGETTGKLLSQNLLNLGIGYLGAVILELFKFFRPFRRDQIGSG